MLSDSYSIIYLITNLFSIAILHRFMTSFFDKRQTSELVCTLSYLSHFILTSIVYLLFDIPILTVIINCLVVFGITLNYHSTMQNRIFVSINIILFMSLTEIMIGVMSGYFHFSFLSKGNYKDVIGLVIARLSAYMIALMSKNFKSLKNNQKVSSFEWTASIFIPVTTIVLEVMIIETDGITQAKTIISLFLVFLLNIIAFYLYDSLADSYSKSARLTVLEKENQLYSKQCEIMQESTEELQTFRHDLSNQFAVISELLESEKYELVKNHLSDLTSEIDHSMIYSRYPIHKSHFFDRPNGGSAYITQCYVLSVNGKDLDMYGCHLSSNNYSTELEYLTPNEIDTFEKLMSYFKNINNSSYFRELEADTIVRSLAGNKNVIVMGDMNDIAGSTTMRILSKAGLKDAWSEGGFGYGATIHYPLPYRIDHILYNEGLVLKGVKVIDTSDISDHNALVAVFDFSN